MSCEEIRELFSGHLDGDLSPEAEDRLGAHLGTCRACREELASYETGLGALAGTGPEPPSDLGPRVVRRLAAEGLLTGPRKRGTRAWGSLAAALVFLGVGLIVGRANPSREDDARRGPGPSVPGWDACAGAPAAVAALDPRDWRALAGAGEPDLTLTAGPHDLLLPRRLLSHGPYDAGAHPAVESGGTTCLPLRTPFGTGLTLGVRPGANGDRGEADRFVVGRDPHRVLYGRVVWQQDGLVWSLEGRAESAELLDVAREIVARARVERHGDQM
jgi:anti-sigma factor RsiW